MSDVAVDLIIHLNREGRDVASNIISISVYTLYTVKAIFRAGYERSHIGAVKAFPPQVVLQMFCNMKSVLYIMVAQTDRLL